MNQYDNFAIKEEDIIRETAMSGRENEWRLLRSLKIPQFFNDPQETISTKRGLVVDVETTGLSENDDVIELAMLPFDYDAETGLIFEVHQPFEAFQEPKAPINEDAALVHGITYEMVAGKSIDVASVESVVCNVDLIVAHNASFDRPKLEKQWECFVEKHWACSLTLIDWFREGMNARNLEYLGQQFGWIQESHRALSDCENCLAVLAQKLPKSGRRVMSVLRQKAVEEKYLVIAARTDYERRAMLRNRGYMWRGADKEPGRVWWKVSSDYEVERGWLESEIYGYTGASIRKYEINGRDRYTDRIWNFA